MGHLARPVIAGLCGCYVLGRRLLIYAWYYASLTPCWHHFGSGKCSLNSKTVLLLGPLAVQPDLRGRGYGRQIVAEGLARAAAIGKWPLVLVSGEPDYYPKFGFVPAAPYQLDWPGFVEPERLQFLELHQGALAALRPPLRVRAIDA